METSPPGHPASTPSNAQPAGDNPLLPSEDRDARLNELERRVAELERKKAKRESEKEYLFKVFLSYANEKNIQHMHEKEQLESDVQELANIARIRAGLPPLNPGRTIDSSEGGDDSESDSDGNGNVQESISAHEEETCC